MKAIINKIKAESNRLRRKKKKKKSQHAAFVGAGETIQFIGKWQG